MVTFPNAKINLGLHITAKRPDGFHAIESCFYPVDWTDVLEVLPAETVQFKSTGLPIPGEEATNLCLKAYGILKSDFPELPPVRIHLHKVIPIGAGLGGGSADGAFMLNALNQRFDLKLTLDQLENYARKLGSDCAFFIRNTPRFCVGKGDEFEEIELSLKGTWAVLVNPGIHISTAEAYGGVTPRQPEIPLRESLRQPMSSWRDLVKNEFEEKLLVRYPLIAEVKARLYAAGANYASLTGSGSTVYGLFSEQKDHSSLFPNLSVWQGVLN